MTSTTPHTTDRTPTTQEIPMSTTRIDPTPTFLTPETANDTTLPASAARLTVRRRDPLPYQPRVLRTTLELDDRRDFAEEELDWLHSRGGRDPRNAGRRAVLL